MEKEDFKKNSQNEFKNKWHEKRMYGQFAHEMPEEIDKDLSWKWWAQSDFKVRTEPIHQKIHYVEYVVKGEKLCSI